MTIATTINPVDPVSEFPTLRRWIGEISVAQNARGTLVVLFTSSNRGVALSGVPANRIGCEARWSDHNGPEWAPASITITSET